MYSRLCSENSSDCSLSSIFNDDKQIDCDLSEEYTVTHFVKKKRSLQYYLIGKEKSTSVKPQGYNTRNESFKRTKETTIEKIKKLCYETRTNKDVLNSIIEEQGGVELVKSGSDLSREKKQVVNFKLNSKGTTDPLIELSALAKDQEKVRHGL